MRAFLFILLAAFAAGTGPNSEAADLPRLKDLFSRHFQGSFYREGKCGENTETLLRLASSHGIELSGAVLVYVQNQGFSNFGLVAAYQARRQGRLIDPASDQRAPGDANWGFHAFVLADGHVLDFDFTNSPQVLPLAEYLAKMFAPPAKSGDAAYLTKKLAAYSADIYRLVQPISGDPLRLPRAEFFHTPVSQPLLSL